MNGEADAAGISSAEVAAQAERAAGEAAQRAGVEIVELDEPTGLTAATDLFTLVWQTSPDDPPVPANLLRALAHTGHYVVGARHGSEVVGAAAGFLSPSRADTGSRDLLLHSHIAGVHPAWQGRHVGLALKLHQRAWALAQGIRRVEWTFDPLVRRNAYFNVAKLGANLVAYAPNFYGAMTDGVNAGDETDRCFARWDVAGERAVDASEGRTVEPNGDILRSQGAVVLLSDDGYGDPRVAPPGALAGYQQALCWVPADIVAVRSSDPDRAWAWRRALRATLGAALAGDFVVTGVNRAGWYALERVTPEVGGTVS